MKRIYVFGFLILSLFLLIFVSQFFQTNPVQSQSKICPTINRTLKVGLSGADVISLQNFLKSQGDFPANSVTTSYFGPVTESAVKKFQARMGIVSSGDAESTGYGVVGALTRATLNSLCGGESVSLTNFIPKNPTVVGPTGQSGTTSTTSTNSSGSGSTSSNGTTSSPADLNGDNMVNQSDLNILFLIPYGNCPASANPCFGDVNQDGVIGFDDLVVLLSLWTGSSQITPTGPEPEPEVPYQTTSSITQYGITWTFDKAYQYGQFKNGDYWVKGPVTVTSVSPNWNGSTNGSMIDPVPTEKHGYDSRVSNYSVDKRVTFPRTISGVSSLISTIGLSSCKPDGAKECLNTAAVLTIVNNVPAANSFRPSYVAGSKKIWSTSQVNYNLLPRLQKPSGVTLIDLSDRITRVWLDHGEKVDGARLHPLYNMPPYPRDSALQVSRMSLLAMLDIPERTEYANRLIQLGIDLYDVSLTNGDAFRAYGGFGSGRKWPILFAGIMLNDSNMKSPPRFISSGSTVEKFGEDGHTYYGAPTAEYPDGKPLWGQDCVVIGFPPAPYFGNHDCRDPGGVLEASRMPNGGSYQGCCTSYTWVGQALAAKIMGAVNIWGHDAFFDYIDRWTSDSSLWVDDSDNVKKDTYGFGGNGNGFMMAMWNKYHDATINLPEPEEPQQPETPAPGTTSSITQYGITWTFDKAYPYGQFANGDYWVKGPITITRITPDFTGTTNGWEINPSDSVKQGFDVKITGFDASKVPSLPRLVQANSSVVKAMSLASCNSGGACLKTAAVLTVLGSIPPENGANTFRPPYAGSEKPLYSTSQIRTNLLPSLSSTSGAPTLSSVASSFQRVWLDHKSDWSGAPMHPADNMPTYGTDIANKTNEAALRLMLNDSVQTKMPALTNYMQYGIDLYGMLKIGTTFPANEGHGLGRLFPLLFTGHLLGANEIISKVQSVGIMSFHENASVKISRDGVPVWGQTGSEYQYWYNRVTGSGSKTSPDPYGYIDGGPLPGGSYQYSANAMQFKGVALAVKLMPEIKSTWNYQPFFDYTDRWVTFGAWSQPDVCAPESGSLVGGVLIGYGITYGPNGSGGCILDNNSSDGIGRNPSTHGANANNGGQRSSFVDSMWSKYRGATAPIPSVPIPVIPVPGDTTAPVRSGGSPSGSQPAGTTSISLSLSTNENATCKYDEAPGTGYDAMSSTFSSTGGKNHSRTISGFSNGASQTYYAKCKDTAGNANLDDFPISFSIANTAPSIPQIPGMTPGQNPPPIQNPPSGQPTSITQGLVGYYTLNSSDISGNTIADRSGNGYNGTLKDSPVSIPGKFGEALRFQNINGLKSHVLLPQANFNITSALTLSAWINPSENKDQNIIVRGKSIGGDVPSQVYSLRFLSSGKVMFHVSSGTSGRSVTSISTAPLNSWTHIAGVFDGTDIKIYVNGSMESSLATGYSTLNSAPANGSTQTAIGIDAKNLKYIFTGGIDEARIYSRALSSSDISAVYQYSPSASKKPSRNIASVAYAPIKLTILEEVSMAIASVFSAVGSTVWDTLGGLINWR